MITDVNFLAVLVSAIGLMALGFLWYSPVLFGNLWMKASGLSKRDMAGSEAQKCAKRGYLSSFVGGLVTAYILALFLENILVDSWQTAVQIAVLLWIGFRLAPSVSCLFFEKKSPVVFAVNVGFDLVYLVMMSILLTLWQ